MTGLENAQHDLSDAQFSLETAIDLLHSISLDTKSNEPELNHLIEQLMSIKTELATSYSTLQTVQTKFES